MAQLTRQLKIVWGNDPPKRYLPKSLVGGTGWRIFDRKTSKFLSDSEVGQISLESLANEVVAN